MLHLLGGEDEPTSPIWSVSCKSQQSAGFLLFSLRILLGLLQASQHLSSKAVLLKSTKEINLRLSFENTGAKTRLPRRSTSILSGVTLKSPWKGGACTRIAQSAPSKVRYASTS